MSPAVITFCLGFLILILFAWYLATASERAKRILGSLLTVLVTGLCIYSAFPPFDEFTTDANGNKTRTVHGKIQQGIDLKGGMSWLIKLEPAKDKDGNVKAITQTMVERAMETFRKRVDDGGVGEPVIAPAGSWETGRILIQLPGVDAKVVAENQKKIEQVAKLEFKMVHPQSSPAMVAQIESGAQVMDPAYEIKVLKHESKDKLGNKTTSEEKLLVKREADIPGSMVTEAYPYFGQKGWEISLRFNSEGAKLFAQLTTENVGKRFAIMLDNEVHSAPNINEPISGGSASISGGSIDENEARNLASILENPLENPVKIESQSEASASLGQDAIDSGKLAGLLATAITVFLVLLYYRFAGFVANIALIIFIVMLFGSMGMFKAVLTLPGIAGILLTLGMAIDANVLIYERLREEQAAGKSLTTALNAAYDKAFSAIFDSNLTTLITAVILYYKATGPVKGFAVSLIIGVVASMFTALVVTRNLFEWVMSKGILKSMTMANLIPNTNFDFMGKRKGALTFSIVIIVASMGIFAMRGEKNFGVDFKGGDRLVLRADGPQPALDAVRAALKEINYGEASVQTEKSAQAEFLVVRDAEGSAEKVEAHLKAKFPESKLVKQSVERIGSLVGKELATNSVVALVLGMFGILIYLTVRFEFSFAIGALVALVHDVAITIGVFALLGRELSLVTVGAILTIAGYSVNDTIVVFDRIRENIKAERAGSIASIMNISVNETLSRTVLTGGVTLITTIILFFLGGPVLNDFALCMLIGIIVGTYSSIYIASPIVLWWSGRGGKDLKREVRKGDEEAVVPA
ncbi:MAG: Protein translocase subunit SecD [Verrucomicrobiota bacterium]|jgi:SecD/SecF fusion protein